MRPTNSPITHRAAEQRHVLMLLLSYHISICTAEDEDGHACVTTTQRTIKALSTDIDSSDREECRNQHDTEKRRNDGGGWESPTKTHSLTRCW